MLVCMFGHTSKGKIEDDSALYHIWVG